MNMIIGTVNSHLMPIVPVNVRNEDNDWEQFELLLDTGFDGAVALELDLINRHCLQTRPTRLLLTPEFVSERDPKWGHIPPFTVEALLDGAPREASLLILDEHPFSGMLGTEILKFHRVTVDVVEGGLATVETCPRSPAAAWAGANSEIANAQDPSEKTRKTMRSGCTETFRGPAFRFGDGEGDWHTIWVNVDTGSSEELSLPSSWVSRLGLRLPNESQMETVNGPLAGHSGKVEIIMEGERHCTECFSRNDGAPPLIGMKLLEGNRITIDFEDFAGTNEDVEIKPIPKSRPYMGGFLRSLADRLRL